MQKKKIYLNIKIINTIIFDVHRDANYVAKLLRIQYKVFTRWMRKYKEWVYKKSEQQRRKNKMKIERLIDINELIQVYMGLNREKEPIRMEFWALLILETIDDNSKSFTFLR